MNAVTLVKPAKQHQANASAYIQEHFAVGENHLHGASLLGEMDSYDNWLAHLDKQSNQDTVGPDWVVASTFFALDTSGRLVGIIDIRHYLNEFLAGYGGHIGYGVRPCERRKGYAAEILRLGLEYCKAIGLRKVMLSCNKENVASAKTIVKNGGVLEKEFQHTDDKTVQTYWITL